MGDLFIVCNPSLSFSDVKTKHGALQRLSNNVVFNLIGLGSFRVRMPLSGFVMVCAAFRQLIRDGQMVLVSQSIGFCSDD